MYMCNIDLNNSSILFVYKLFLNIFCVIVNKWFYRYSGVPHFGDNVFYLLLKKNPISLFAQNFDI